MEGLVAPRALVNPKANVSLVSYGDDSGAFVTFEEVFIPNVGKSADEGRAVYDSFVQVELQWPGDNTKTFKKVFKFEEGAKGNEWTERFPKAWEAFKNGKEQVPDGTPIELWPVLTKQRVLELKAAKIHTIEHIASLTDTTGANCGLDWRKLRDQANAFLHPQQSAVEISRLGRENDELKNRIAALENQISNIGNISTSVNNLPVPKRRGRKPKAQPQGDDNGPQVESDS